MKLKTLEQLGIPTQFPKFFPPQLELYRTSLAEAADTPDEYGAAYMLAAGATAAGANVSACVQPGWCVRANLFVAVVGHKGSGKSTLRNKVLAPLVRHEEELRQQAALDADDDQDDDVGDGDGDAGGRRDRSATPPEPCVIVNDTTGPAMLRLLEQNRRQLLNNTDEISTLFIRNTGGTDRQLWCELYDGHRRRQQRASARGLSITLAAPYVCVLGGIQPDLLRCMYGSRGDDGLVDRVLVVGDRGTREAEWPRDADDPLLNAEWAAAIERLLRVEHLATDAIGEQVESRFKPDAVEAFRRLMRRLNALMTTIGVPAHQRGIVKKLVQHGLKLALLRRCFRWAAGEFGANSPLGDIDADDAEAACEATLFFLGRWLIWRPELCPGEAVSCEPIGLAAHPGDDPVLLAIEAEAAGAQAGIRLIERLARFLRAHGPEPVSIAALATAGPMAMVPRQELQAACEWLVTNGHAAWANGSKEAISLPPLPARRRKSPRRPRAPATLVQSGGREIEL